MTFGCHWHAAGVDFEMPFDIFGGKPVWTPQDFALAASVGGMNQK